MLFPETLYEKDLPTDPASRRLVMSLANGRCTAAVWDDNVPTSLRVVATDRISVSDTGLWTGLEDFLYDNPGLLSPMARTTVLLDTPDVAIVPQSMDESEASRLLRMTAVSDDAADPNLYQCAWEAVGSCKIGMLLPSKLYRFIRRSFQPVSLSWYASVITRYWSHIVATTAENNTSHHIHVLAVVGSPCRVTVIALNDAGNLIAAVSRKGTGSSDLSYYILSLLTSLSADIRSEVSLSLYGNPAVTASIKKELSGWIDAHLHIHVTGKPSIIDQAQFSLLEPEILAAIES